MLPPSVGVVYRLIIYFTRPVRVHSRVCLNVVQLLPMTLLMLGMAENSTYLCSQKSRKYRGTPKFIDCLTFRGPDGRASRFGEDTTAHDGARQVVIVDHFHVEAGEGVRTCMSTFPSSGKSLACSEECMDDLSFPYCGAAWHSQSSSGPYDQTIYPSNACPKSMHLAE